jgi:DNA repair protein RadA/Sms
MRAQRLGLTDAPVILGAETNLRDILTTLDAERPALAIIDSIQTMWLDTVESAPGSVSQVRAAAHELVTFAKRRGVAVILVGHVTKDGQIAGPRVVEHMVDTVLYFEGERGHQFRILRAVKNRFGPADEIGVFEMTGGGLAQVTNPSALFLSDRDTPAPGSVVFAGIEGTRPVLTEIQALVAPSTLGTPRRTVVGSIPAASPPSSPCSKRAAASPSAGSMCSSTWRAACASANRRPIWPSRRAAFGKGRCGNSARHGAFRRDQPVGRAAPAGQTENRLKEASKLGFSQATLPSRSKLGRSEGMRVRQMPDLTAFVGEMFGAG